MGWSEFENEEKKAKDIHDDSVTKFCSLCYQLFEINPIGQEFIELLNNQLATPVCPPDKEASWGYFREGQNNIIRQIKNAIIFHKSKMGTQS